MDFMRKDSLNLLKSGGFKGNFTIKERSHNRTYPAVFFHFQKMGVQEDSIYVA
jgi:hypothetical protein